MFFNGRKVLIIPPLLANDKLFINFSEKANIFNEFFRQQCRPISNDSTVASSYKYHTDERIICFNFVSDKHLKKKNNFRYNKANGYDGVSIRMSKLSSQSILTISLPVIIHNT